MNNDHAAVVSVIALVLSAIVAQFVGFMPADTIWLVLDKLWPGLVALVVYVVMD